MIQSLLQGENADGLTQAWVWLPILACTKLYGCKTLGVEMANKTQLLDIPLLKLRIWGWSNKSDFKVHWLSRIFRHFNKPHLRTCSQIILKWTMVFVSALCLVN